jgi:hypothetical protein
MVPLGRIELPASPLPMVRSTTELQRPDWAKRRITPCLGRVLPQRRGGCKKNVRWRAKIYPASGFASRCWAVLRLEILLLSANAAAMSNDKQQQQQASQKALKLKSAAKQAQLSEALRANLKRRKEQSRERKKAPNA